MSNALEDVFTKTMNDFKEAQKTMESWEKAQQMMNDFEEADAKFKTLINSGIVKKNQWLFAAIVASSDDELDQTIQDVIKAKIKYKEATEKLMKIKT